MAEEMERLEPGRNAADYTQMSERLGSVVGCENWDAIQLAEYFEKAGLGDYEEMLINHKINGRIVHLLTDADLKEMGVNIVGDRLRFKHHLKTLSRKARHAERNKTIWEGEEKLYWSGAEAGCMTCCGACPEDPSTYKLTSNYLRLKTVEPARCGPIKLCCCLNYSVNNVDLTHVEDIDVIGSPAPCLQQVFCCAQGKDIVEVQTVPEGKVILTLDTDEGDKLSELLMNQVEEAQVMERD